MIKIGLILGYGASFGKNKATPIDEGIATVFGDIAGPAQKLRVNDKEVYILFRHGIGENIPLFEVNYKANVLALKELGCELVLSTSLCGSLQEEICPGEFVVFDQFIDISNNWSFSDKLPAADINSSAIVNPFDNSIRNCMIQAAITHGITVHTKSTVVTTNGSRHSTRAESNLFRNWGADVINTTTIAEAILCHELKIPYGNISLCTHYDSWRTDIRPATQNEKDEVIEIKKEYFEMIIDNCVMNLCTEEKIEE